MKKLLFCLGIAMTFAAHTAETPSPAPFISYQSPSFRPYSCFDFSLIGPQTPFSYPLAPNLRHQQSPLLFKTTKTKVDFQDCNSAAVWIKPSSFEASMNFSLQTELWPELKGNQEKLKIKMSFEKQF